MSDIALVWDEARATSSFVVENNDLATDDGLRTAVILSLFLDREADSVSQVTDGSGWKRGWWGDAYAPEPGDKIGSLLWLLDRSTNNPKVLPAAESYASNSLQWLLDDKVALSVDVGAEFLSGGAGLALNVEITRPNVGASKFRFASVWVAEGAR